MNPPLGVHDVGNTCARASSGELETACGMLSAIKILFQRFHLVFAVHHEFDVVPGGES